jgi:NhaP-type Na+/H+ or K+/H+ antiporter
MEYYIIIAGSLVVILSYFFGLVSRRTNIPSVLLLIASGVAAREITIASDLGYEEIMQVIKNIRLIELFGTLGLIMIVLEAALDLELRREKIGLIVKALLSAFAVLLASAFCIAFIVQLSVPGMGFLEAMIYATPLSILSSAIVIPSVTNLPEQQKEFAIYDSTFSDILGIMMFYFLIELAKPTSDAVAVGDFLASLVLTIFISVFLSYILIYIFQNMVTKVKLFLMISVLVLLYSVGKMLHLSSLIIILIFGLILSNPGLFFVGTLRYYMNNRVLTEIYATFHLVTMETAFVIRTFFFFIFGFSVSLLALMSWQLAFISGIIIIVIYLVRGILMRLIVSTKDSKLSTFIAPRGLITLLLFYSIPPEVKHESFNEGILLFVIIITSIVMTYGLIRFGKTKENGIEETNTPDTASPDE